MTADRCTPIPDGAVSRSPVTDRVRRSAFSVLRSGTPALLSELAASTGQSLPVVRAVLTELVAAGVATVDGDLSGDPVVDGVDGLTARITPHQLTLSARILHTWCGFDTVGIPAALGVDATVNTHCPGCGSAVDLMLPGGQTPDSPVVGWWPQPGRGPVNQTFCPTASLFCSREHLDTWRKCAPGPGEALSLTELAERGQATWSLLTDSDEHP